MNTQTDIIYAGILKGAQIRRFERLLSPSRGAPLKIMLAQAPSIDCKGLIH